MRSKITIRPSKQERKRTSPNAPRSTEMRSFRCIIGGTLPERIHNEDTIRNTCEIQDVITWARIRRRAWRDHVNRMDDNRLAKIAKNGKPNTSKPPGPPSERRGSMHISITGGQPHCIKYRT
ncbi:hypothetical protein HN011_012000 [Eciton burchellii]|jgi:hypothetical protein|nr:hypothetical protein HN011_012000 [Eciton burchellii]